MGEAFISRKCYITILLKVQYLWPPLDAPMTSGGPDWSPCQVNSGTWALCLTPPTWMDKRHYRPEEKYLNLIERKTAAYIYSKEENPYLLKQQNPRLQVD